MLEINIAEAQSHLSQILSQVEQGEEVIITRGGKAIARLSPIYKNLQPLTSRTHLRASQPLMCTSSLETLLSLRDEARY